MLPVSWNAEALADLEQILGYIAERNPAAADRLLFGLWLKALS
jgi:plasmid stabilization system protein ParE